MLQTFRSIIIRHRIGIQDLAIIAAGFAIAANIAYELDIFANEPGIGPKEHAIELDEALLLGCVLAVGFLIFSIRRYIEQKREARRLLEAEQQQVRILAFQDALTGLANRRQFEDALKAAFAAPPKAGAVHALLLLDLNGFKRINDVYGHRTGDDALVIVSQRLLNASRKGNLVARFGGDEFAILAQHLEGPEGAANIGLRVIQSLEADLVIGDSRHRIGAGIGIVLIPLDASSVEEALRKADVALYRAKTERRSAMRFFEEDMDRLIREREMIETELRTAIAANEIRVYFQPSYDLRTREVTGFEVLPRWIHAELGEIPRERFLPIAEETGLIHEFAERILRAACQAALHWPAHILLSIDAFPGQLTDPELSERMLTILKEAGFPPSRLEIEIGESALVRDLEAAQVTFGCLREAGARIVLDNFGTGYSSLYHLRNFKLDKVKIDRSFIGNGQENSALVRALIGLGHGLGLVISAEGVEGAEQRIMLLGSGCEQGQGFSDEAMSAAATIEFFSGRSVVSA